MANQTQPLSPERTKAAHKAMVGIGILFLMMLGAYVIAR